MYDLVVNIKEREINFKMKRERNERRNRSLGKRVEKSQNKLKRITIKRDGSRADKRVVIDARAARWCALSRQSSSLHSCATC